MRAYGILIALALALLSGCASTTQYLEPTGVDNSQTAELNIYRTNIFFHSGNPERPFFFINNALVAKLGTGMAITTKVLPGKQVISVRESILFMPGKVNESIEYQFEAGKTYYLRYSEDFSGIFPIGQLMVATGSTSLQFVNVELYQQRK